MAFVGVAALIVVTYVVGAVLAGSLSSVSTSSGAIDGSAPLEQPQAAVESKAGSAVEQSLPSAAGSADALGERDVAAVATPAPSEALVISNAAMSLRVEEMDAALAKVRAAASANGADVTELSVYAGEEVPSPQPLVEGGAGSYDAPATASITLRVAADKLRALEDDISKVGKVLSQSVSASDVTEEYVDLSARLKNLKAEEVRLRTFLNRTDKVSELLQVERELARVRGEIESTQAQVDYLERQAAKATLVISLSEPGPVVRPQGDDWGFTAAITRGIQAAAALLTTLVSGLIALAPLGLLGVAIWLVVRAIRKRRHTREADAPSTDPISEEPRDTTA